MKRGTGRGGTVVDLRGNAAAVKRLSPAVTSYSAPVTIAAASEARKTATGGNG
jgi:hypothetical protein